MNATLPCRSRQLLTCLAVIQSIAAAPISNAQAEVAHVAPHVTCRNLPGSDALLASGKRYILFGETHGTNETPGLFADLICTAAAREGVVVGLEIPHAEQPAVDAFMASDGGAAAIAKLKTTDHFATDPDGRASQAMLRLVERLRLFRKSGLPIRVVAFVPFVLGSQYNRAMAAAWQESLSASPKGRLIALVGSYHALRAPARGDHPAAMFIPAAETATLGPATVGGHCFDCESDGCKVHRMDGGAAMARGIVKVAGHSAYDYRYSPGRPFTASPPVNPHATDNLPPPPKKDK